MPNFQPTVNYNVPVPQRAQIKIYERPEVNVEPINISGLTKAIGNYAANKDQAAAAQQNQALLSQYASKMDQIQVALNQGEINELDADIARRSTSEQFRNLGVTFEDDLKIRKGYGENVAGIAKQTLESRAKEDEKVKADRREMQRSNPSLKNWDNTSLDNLWHYTETLGRDQQYYKSVLADPYSTKAQRDSANQHLSSTIENEAFAEGQRVALDYMHSVADTGKLDPNFKNQFIQDTTQQMMDRGMAPVVARQSAERLWIDTGLADFDHYNTVDREEATKYMKSREDNFMAAANMVGAEGYRDIVTKFPGIGVANKMSRETIAAMPTAFHKTLADNIVTFESEVLPNGQRGDKQLKFNTAVEAKASVEAFNILLRDPNATTHDKVAAGGVALAGYNRMLDSTPLFDMSPDDLATTKQNLQNVIQQMDTPASRDVIKKAENGKIEDNKTLAGAYNEQLKEAYGKLNATTLLSNIDGATKSMLQSSQANRLRVDNDGNLVMAADRSNLQAFTQMFSDNQANLQRINDMTTTLTPDQKKDMFNQLGVQPLTVGEEVADLSKFNLARSATALAQGAENLINSPKQQSVFTDDIPLEYSTSVSDSSTVAGGSVVPFEQVSNNSAQVLREYAQRAQESLDSAIASGATLEKGSAAKTRKIIADAIKMAEKLEGAGEVFTTKGSSKSTIAGGSAVPAAPSDDMAQEMQRMVAEQSPESYEGPVMNPKEEAAKRRQLNKIETELEQLEKGGRYRTNKYLDLSTKRVQLLKDLGEWADDDE